MAVRFTSSTTRRTPTARRKRPCATIARGIGFDDVTFQFEPIAAALDYERQIASEEVALIADIGGGTSDFSIVRLGPERHGKADRAADILANDGVRIGGTDFDRQLSLGVVMPLFGFGSAMKRPGSTCRRAISTTLRPGRASTACMSRACWPISARCGRRPAEPELLDRLMRVVHEQRGHTLAMEVEDAKIALSEQRRSAIPLEWVAPGLSAAIGRPDLVSHTKQLADRIAARIKNCLVQAGLTAGAIDAVFLTGGSVKLAHVHKAITKAVPSARIVEGDIFGAVGKGLTLEALRRYGPAN